MKKLIQSKRFSNKCPDLQRKQDGPKQLLLSNWMIRNDSGSVAALLHPDIDIPRQYLEKVPWNSDVKHIKQTGVFRKCCLGSNSCYCKEDPIRPKLLRRPNKCLSLEDFEDKYRGRFPGARSSLHCFCKGDTASADHVDLSDQAILRKYQEELDDLNKNLQITDQRKDYEIFRDHQHTQYLKDIGQYKTSTIMSTLPPHSRPGSSGFITEGLNSDDINMFTRSSRNIDDTTDSEDDECGGRYQKSKTPHERHTIASMDNYTDKRIKRYPQNTYGNIYKPELYHNKVGKKISNNKSIEEEYEEYEVAKISDQTVCKRGSLVEYAEESPVNHNALIRRRPYTATSDTNKEYTSYSNHVHDEDIYPMPGEDVNVIDDRSHGSMNLEQFRNFRNENYFETHDFEAHLAEEIPPHTCVHKYQLNNRYASKGVNVDMYGNSRCSICNQSIQTTPEKSYFGDGISSKKLRSLSKCHQLGLAPSTIVTSRSRIELKIDQKDVQKFASSIGRYRRPQYINTFALRQQRMVSYSH